MDKDSNITRVPIMSGDGERLMYGWYDAGRAGISFKPNIDDIEGRQ